MNVCSNTHTFYPRQPWINPSKRLVNTAIDYWNNNKLRADNCTAVTALLDPPGPPLSGLLAWQKTEEPVRPEADPPAASTIAAADADNSIVVEASQPAPMGSHCDSLSELAALLSAPVVNADLSLSPLPPPPALPQQQPPTTPPKSILIQRTNFADEASERPRVLRNRTLSASSLDNSSRFAKRGSASSASLANGLRKKVVTMEAVALSHSHSRKRPVTRSFHHETAEDRGASDTENQVKKSRHSLPAGGAHQQPRILRSSVAPVAHLVRTLRSQESNSSAGLRTSSSSTAAHYRKKRSRSFTPVKRRK